MRFARRVALVAAASASLATAASGDDVASPCAPLTGPAAAFAANDNHVGVIDLYVFGAQRATFFECAGERALSLGERSDVLARGYTPMYAATAWSCSRRTRRFAVVVPQADGSVQRGLTDIRTPSCALRFRVVAPAHARSGRPVRLRFVDRWGIGGIATRWCVTAPGGHTACHALRFGTASRTTRRWFVPRRRGRWRATLHVGRYRVVRDVFVGVRPVSERRLPRVLATGDSTMQGVDAALADELAGTATVISGVHPGAGLSFGDGWEPVARRQAVTMHAATIVLSIGADEGWPMAGPDGTEHRCCGADWTDEYARRMRRVLRIYRHHAQVVVLTVVAPRDPARAPIVAASTAATIRVASAMSGVRLLRMDRFFTPDGYQETVRYRGRDVAVREPDGVHLNVAGTTIEARKAVPAVRATLPKPGKPGALSRR